MGLTCPAAIVTLFLLELSSLYQDLPADLGTIPVENHELVVFQPYSQGSVIASNFDNVHILHVQEDPAYNPYFGLDGQSSMLNSKVYLNLSQTNTGTFLMAVNKQNQPQVVTLFCVTYCIGNLSDPTMHDVCYDTINAGNLYSNTSASLLSQYIYEKNISFHIPVAYGLLQLEMTPGNKSNVTFLGGNYSDLFFMDHQGVLRTGRNITEQDVGSHTIEVGVLATVSGVSRVDWALIKVNVVLENAMPPTFEHPHGYTFSVKEEEGGGLSVGFVKALYFDLRMNGKISYSFTEPTIFFQINQTSGEIQTSVSLDRETVNRHMLTVVAADNSSPESLSSQVEVLVLVEDVNDNPPVFVEKEYSLSLSLYTQPGLLLRVNATDADVGQNAEVVYTITDGNANEMFRINSTSGELFLIAPLTVAVGDSIVLHVKADDKLPVNSLQASALVKITFVGVATTASQEDPVALVSGVSVGGILLVGAIVLLSLYIWKKRRKRDWDRRRKQESLPMICTRQKEPRYDEHFSSMRKTEKRSSSNLYHLKNNSGSCVNLEHIEMEPWIPSPSQIPIHTSGSFSSENEFSMARFKGSQVVVEVSATKPKAQIGLTSLAQKSEIPSSHYEAKISNVSKDISKRESLKEGTHVEFFQSTVVHRSPSAPTLLKQNSQNSVYQQLKAMTPVSEWRSLPGSRLNLEPESVSLASRDSYGRVLPHVESTGMKAEKEQRYSHTCLEHTEMESQPLSLMPQQRSQSLVSLPDKCLVSARVNSAPSSTYRMQLGEMESEPPFPSLKGRPRTRILPNDGYAPVQAELAPSSLKGAQASCSADSQSKSASLSTEELSTSLRTQTAENGEGYSQVSLRLSELDPESLSPSPKKRSDDSRSLTDFEGRVDQGDTSVVASYPRNVVESHTPVYPEESRDLRTVTFKSLPALQPPDTTFEKSKEQPIKPTSGQTSGVKSSPCIVGEKCLADGVRKTPSSLEDISEGACHKEILSTERTGTPVLVSSSDNSFKSLSNEDVPLHGYKTALVGSSSFQLMSQFSRSRSSDKESNSSLEDNDFSAESLKQASVGSSSQFQPATSRFEDDSRSLTGFEVSVDQDDTSVVASYPRNVVEGQNPVFPEGSRDLRTVTFKSLQALQPPDTTFENSKEQPIKQMTGQQITEVMPSPCIVEETCLADGVRKTPSSILEKGRKSSECGEDLGESSSSSSKDGSDSLSSVEHRLLTEKAKASPQSLTGSLAQAGLTSLSILLSSEKQVSELSQPSIESRLSPAGVKSATSSLTEAQLNVYDEGTVAETFIIPSESSELIGGRFEDKEPVSRSTSISLSSKVMSGGVQSDTLSRAESLKEAPVGTSSQFRPSTSHLQDETRSPSCSEGSMDQNDVSVAASYQKELVESQNLVFPEVGRGLTVTTSKSLKELQPLDTTFEHSSEQPIKQTTSQQMKLESKSPSSSKEERSESLYLFEDRLLLEGATSVPNLRKGYQKGSSIELRSNSAPLLTAEISQSLSSQVESVGARTGGEQCFSHAGRELGSESLATFSKKRTDSSPLLEDRLPPERVKSTPTLSERSQETSTLNSPSNSASLLTEEFSQSLCSQIWPAKVIAERGQSYSHGSLGQDGFESESLSQLTMQRSQSSSSSLHDQCSQAAPSSLRKLGISVSDASALESSPCLAEKQPQNLLPHPEPAASILDKKREFSECKEDVGESSPLWSKERSDRLSLLEHRLLPEKAEASPQSLLGSLAQAGVTSLSILAPFLTKVPSNRLLLPSQTARKPAEGEQKDSQGSLILGAVETESPSSGKQVFGSSLSSHDGRFSSVIAKSKPSSLTDVEVKIDDGGKITETMTLPSDFVEQISGKFESEKHISRPFGKSASSDVKTPAGNVDLGSLQSDAQSKYSIQASVGTLPQRTLATSHLEGESRSAQDSLGRVILSEMEYKSFDTSHPKHVLESQKQVFSQVSLDSRTVTPISLPALKFPNKSSSETEIKQSVGKRIVQVKSCPCILESYARETPSQMMGVRDDQNYEELPARDNSVTAVNSPSLDDSFTSSSNEDVPISSYKTALSGPSSFQIPHQFFHIETSDKESTSSFEDNKSSSASEGDLRDNESCTILKTHENIHVETFPGVLKSAERLIYLKTVDSHQTVMRPAFTVEQTEDLSKLPLAETPRPSLSAPQRDDSERPPPRSSAEDSSSNEDVTLSSYTTVLIGSTSVRVPSQFFQIESSDKESSSSLENNEFSSSGEDNLRDNESYPMLETLEKLHVESSHEVLKVAGRLDHHKTLDSYQTHVLPTLTGEQTEDLSRLTVADSARPSFSVPRKNDPEKALFSSSSDYSFTSSASEDVPISSYRTALSDPLWFQIPSKFFQIESSDKESSCSFEDNEFLSASESNLSDNDKESRSYLEGTAFSPADEDDSPHKESFPKRYIQENVQNEMLIPVMKTDDRPLLPVAIMDASAVEEPGLASPKESQFAAGSSSHSFLDIDFLQQSKEADFNYSISTELYGVEKRDRTLTEVPSSVLSSDLSPRTVSKVPPQRSRISEVGRKFKKIFKIGNSKNRHKELQKLEPEGDSSDFDGKTEEPPTSGHWGIGHPTSHSSVSTLRDNCPFLAVAVETTESSILHSKGIAPSGQDSISSDVASSSANLYASAIETERPATVQSSIPRDRGILTTDDAAIAQRVNEMISTIVKNARAALECKIKDEISEPPCSLSDAVTTQRINEMINTIVNNARAASKCKLKDAEMSLCEQSMKSSSKSSLLATEPFLSPNAKDSLSIITEISQGNRECTLQDISRRPSSETSFSPFLAENRETAGQEPPCSLLDTATTRRINAMIKTIVSHARGALQYQLKENSSLDQPMKSNCESLLLATESSASPIIKESASCAVESLPGNLECLLQLEEIPSWTDHPDTWKESEVEISPAAPENITVEEDKEKLQGAGSSVASRNSASSEESHDDLTNNPNVFRAQED